MNGQRQGRRAWTRRAGRAGAIGFSVAAHAALAVALLIEWRAPPKPAEPAPIFVALVELPRPVPPPPPIPPPEVVAPQSEPAAAAPSAPKAAVAVHSIAREREPAPPQPESPPAAASVSGGSGEGLSEAQLAGAGSADDGAAGGGGEGQGCHMAQRVQAALRRDSLVQAAVAEATAEGPRAIMVWNGDWVQSHSEDGKGLAAVREAIVWEVAFAPQACRAERMRGLILLSLGGSREPARLAVGTSDWRWADLLNR